MADNEGVVEDNITFPAVDASKELNLGVPEQFPVDPISSNVATAKELKEEAEARATAKAAEEKAKQCDLGGTLVSALMISGVVIAAIGVAFFVTRKLKEA